MLMTLVELMRRINEKRTAGFHAQVELTATYHAPKEPHGPKEWRPKSLGGTWTLNTGLHLEYRYMVDGGKRQPLPVFQGPRIRFLLEEMVSFFNSGRMLIFVPANSYGIDGYYELTEKIELGKILC